MPAIDKPLSELLIYPGTNPRPTDFDTYWDESLAELDKHDAQVTLTPNPFLKTRNAECFDLTFTGIGGARVYAKYLRPKNIATGKKVPAVVQFHGYSGSSGDWADKLNLVNEGFAVAAMDVRGQGGRSEDNLAIQGNTLRGHIIRGLDDPDPRKLFFRYVYLDCALLARIVMGLDEVDAERVAAMGGSQGGALTIACVALEPRVKFAAPVFPFLCDYKRVWDMDLAKDAYAELKEFFRHFDPRHERELEIFTKLGYIDLQYLAPRIKATTLMAVGLMDTICPPSTQFAMYNKITAPKDLIIYPDFGHEGLPGCNDRIFNFIVSNLAG